MRRSRRVDTAEECSFASIFGRSWHLVIQLHKVLDSSDAYLIADFMANEDPAAVQGALEKMQQYLHKTLLNNELLHKQEQIIWILMQTQTMMQWILTMMIAQ
ncbi:hypothetical protein CVT25_004108 [Psilocybe cyanescens]|uniref:Uncharacterized protein n=1 Tax=Psilocybe cyanescens TaxID=93625 RepID=A0A409X322_PSICY|nr:hypothetical protein CVT25_004108 [Psilocybe cyanescens]